MSFFDKLKDKFEDKLHIGEDDHQKPQEHREHHEEQQSAPDEPREARSAPDEPPRSEIWTLSARDVYRYRKQYGVNLGSW